ncbi:hypothetical protein PLICRDRAFT_145598, partial [Plicaturopsis crispa FD-325 SS-3]
MGNRGFPLSHRRLKEHVDEICRARLGSKFPATGVGKNWTHRFAEKHSERIRVSWSRPLDSKRGRAVNPNTNEAWWSLLKKTLTEFEIEEKNTYGIDEVGCPPYSEDRERVFGARKLAPQYQQRGGARENITVLTTICADGTAIAPAVIFKGSAYQMKWAQNNPAKASIGYQKKGWTDGEIGAEWIRHFDEATTEKANGAYRLLLVDGHNSHYTLQFLKYAREHKIIVLCYPAHATHIYQGLDVVIFAVVKRYLNEERDKWMRENAKAIDKTNFLEIYGKAHLRALTPDTIKAAFRKTGVWPFNPDVVPEEAMAPSKETSAEGHLPIVPATPVRVMADLIKKLTISDDIDELDEADLSGTDAEPSTPTIPRRSDKMKAAFESAVHALSQTNLDYLASGEKVLAAAPMPQTQ